MGTKMDMIFVSGIWEGTTSPDCGWIQTNGPSVKAFDPLDGLEVERR